VYWGGASPIQGYLYVDRTLSAKNLTCSDVTRFDDANGNHVVDPAEVKGPIDCKS
jgi:hypothetical protein